MNRFALYCLACLISLAAACSSWTHHGNVDRDGEMKDFTSNGGYAWQNYTVESTRETWLHDDLPIEVSIMIPNAPGQLPVVVYLPGVGEDTGHGELWRRPWAQAGYVVVTLQPKQFGGDLWVINQLKPGDFKAIGKAIYSQRALENRVVQLQWTLAKLAARIRSGDKRYTNIDMGRMALVGYDLGTQTVMALAGEKTGLTLPGPLPAFKSAIIISAHADPEAEQLSDRYAGIRMPLLLIGSEKDHDPAKISTPTSRKLIWNGLPSGEKHLLLFDSANHRLLSGTMKDNYHWTEVIEPDTHEHRKKGTGDDGKNGARSNLGNGFLDALKTQLGMGQTPGALSAFGDPSSGGGMGGGGMGGGSGGGRGRQSNTSSSSDSGNKYKSHDEAIPAEEITLQTNAARQMAIIVNVTTAFLDVTLKDSKEARAWLSTDCPAWLKDYAKWQQK